MPQSDKSNSFTHCFSLLLNTLTPKHDVNVMFGVKKGLTMFCFLEPALEAFDMGLKVSTKLLERSDLLVRLSEMLAQDGEDFLFWLSSTGVSEIQVDDVVYFIQAESKLL